MSEDSYSNPGLNDAAIMEPEDDEVSKSDIRR